MSAVSWGASFPAEWPRTRIKYVGRFAGGGTPDKGNAAFWNGDIPWVSPKDMKSATIDDTEDHITLEGLQNSATRLVPPGSVLLVMRSGILRHTIPVAINQVPVALNQDMRALTPFPWVEARFLARLVEGHQQQLLYRWSKVGSTVESLESDLVGETEIAIPPLSQQRAIADYLDRETAWLDALVASKERVLGLLAEKRRVLITRAVTRGLDPRVSLRDSGILWIGEIPAHWAAVPIKYGFGRIGSGTTPPTGSAEYYDGDIPWVTTSELRENVVLSTTQCITRLALEELSSLRVYPVGSVLFAMYGATIGRVALLGIEATVNQAVCVLAEPSRFDPRFVFYTLQASREHLIVLASGGGQPNLNAEKVRDHRLACPPLPEQRDIVDHIEREAGKLDALNSATEGTIALLKERRGVLVAAAVTGQLVVA